MKYTCFMCSWHYAEIFEVYSHASLPNWPNWKIPKKTCILYILLLQLRPQWYVMSSYKNIKLTYYSHPLFAGTIQAFIRLYIEKYVRTKNITVLSLLKMDQSGSLCIKRNYLMSEKWYSKDRKFERSKIKALDLNFLSILNLPNDKIIWNAYIYETKENVPLNTMKNMLVLQLLGLCLFLF